MNTEQVVEELLTMLDNLTLEVYWVIDGGEFSKWIGDKEMPIAAAKELDELSDMMNATVAFIQKYKRDKQ